MTFTTSFQHLKHLTSIDLSGNDIGNNIDRLEQILCDQEPQSVLSRLNLSNSNLDRLPNLTELGSLEVLDVSSNHIKSLATLESNSLTTLTADQNEISVLDFDPERVPSITGVTFGPTEFVHFSILQKVSSGDLQLSISHQHKQTLLVPPPHLLNRPEDLEKYVSCKRNQSQSV